MQKGLDEEITFPIIGGKKGKSGDFSLFQAG
jgi:hypothetical protein